MVRKPKGLNVGVLLQMGDFWALIFSQYAFGEDGTYGQNEAYFLLAKEDPARTHRKIGPYNRFGSRWFCSATKDYYEYE